MPKRAREDGLHSSVLAECTLREWLEGLDEDCFATDTAFQKHILHRRVLDGNGHLVSLSLRAVGIFLKYGIAFGVKRCIKCGGPARFETRDSRGWTTYGWTCKRVGHKHMETQVNVFGFLTAIPVNSWLPFLHMINLLRLGRSFSSITDEILAGYGNIARQTLAKWRDVYQKALGCALTNLDARVIGGKHQVVVMDEAVVGVHAEDGWTGGSRGINKAGAEQNRSSERKNINKMIKSGAMKRLPARTLHHKEKASSSSPFIVNKRPASSFAKKPAACVMKKPAMAPAKRPKKKNLKSNGMWLWLGICVGAKNAIYTHSNLPTDSCPRAKRPSRTSPAVSMRSKPPFRSMSQKVPSWCLMVGVQPKRLSTPSATSMLHQ